MKSLNIVSPVPHGKCLISCPRPFFIFLFSFLPHSPLIFLFIFFKVLLLLLHHTICPTLFCRFANFNLKNDQRLFNDAASECFTRLSSTSCWIAALLGWASSTGLHLPKLQSLIAELSELHIHLID